MERTIDIVFDGPPSHEAPRFVEVERDGQSIRLGEWVRREDGHWALRIPDPEATRESSCEELGYHVCGPQARTA